MTDQKIVYHKSLFYFLYIAFPTRPKNKLAILIKVSSLLYSDYFSSQAWFFDMIYLNFQKD